MKFATYTNDNEDYDPVDMPFIYPDDSIDIVWYKLSEHYRCSIQDIYLFGRKQVSFTHEHVYKLLKQEVGQIPWFHYKNFSNNFEHEVEVPEENITLDIISKSNFVDVTMTVSIGQKMLLPANPGLSNYISNYGSTPLYKQESTKVLLDYFPLLEDTVYICFKRDFESTPMYFDHVVDLDYIQRRLSGLKEIYRLPPPKESTESITQLTCTLAPLVSLVISLDTLFNILHVSETMPMIQYNTGTEETLLYKLYTQQDDIAGNHIPWLSSTKILKRDQSYPKSVAVFFEGVKYSFKEDGSVLFDVVCKREHCSLEDINRKIKRHLKTFDTVKQFMEQSGYEYPSFTSVEECSSLQYTVYFEFSGISTFNLKQNCLSKFLIPLDDKERRYIRVSEFEESKYIYEVCLYLLLNGTSVNQILKRLQETFGMSVEQSQTVWKNYEADLQVLKSKNDNKKLFLKNKEGFTTLLVSSQNVVSFEIKDVPSIHYLPELRRNVNAVVSLCSTKHEISCAPLEVRTIPVQDLITEIDFEDVLEIDSDSEPLDIDSDDESVGQRGGALDKDLILKNDSFLITRIKSVFSSDSQFKEKEYTKKCPLKRCPIALTDAEKDSVYAKKHPSFVMNDRTFVCPKYWDMQNKIPLTDEDLKVEPHKSKRIIDKITVKEKRSIDFAKDGTILELETGDYPYPGVLAKAHGPCCFKLNPKSKRSVVKKPIVEALQRIIEDRNRPMEPSKVARLPKSLQFFFGLPETCMMTKNNYLLRYGVEPPHSFMDCVVSCCMLSYEKKYPNKEAVIKHMAKVVHQQFTKINNGRTRLQFTMEEFLKQMMYMDYTHLWEIVCIMLNINLIVFRIPNDNDVEIICPSNRYMLTPFDPSKLTFMILERNKKKESTFEPIIEHNIQNNEHTLLHDYSYKYLKPTFKEIEKHYQGCKPYSEYYSTNMPCHTLYQLVKDHFKPISQVIQNEMCIGLVLRKVYIPCYPSTPIDKLHVVAMEKAISSYAHTIDVLMEAADYCPCKPRFKVVSNGMVHGIITQTNAFVPCLEEPSIPDDLPLYRGKVEQEYTPLSKHQDSKRIQMYTKLEAEKYCYMEFRRQVKYLLNKTKSLRDEIQQKVNTKTVTEEDIRRILTQYTSLPMDEHTIQRIISCKERNCKDVLIPEINLVTGSPNNYFKRMATELNRYTRISTFILNPQLYIPDTPFSLHPQEMILIGHSAETYLNELKEPRRTPATYDNAVAFHQEKIINFTVKKLNMIVLNFQ
jgi:hypothetical protein